MSRKINFLLVGTFQPKHKAICCCSIVCFPQFGVLRFIKFSLKAPFLEYRLYVEVFFKGCIYDSINVCCGMHMAPQTSTIWPFWPKICIFGRISHFWVYAENSVKKCIFDHLLV